MTWTPIVCPTESWVSINSTRNAIAGQAVAGLAIAGDNTPILDTDWTRVTNKVFAIAGIAVAGIAVAGKNTTWTKVT